MKTKESILRKHLGEDLFKDMSEWLIFPQPSGSFPMIDLIYSAMDELIQEDRQNVAEHAKITSDYYDRYDIPSQFKNWWAESHSNIGERRDVDGDVIGLDIFSIEKDSIINAPNIELK